MSGTPEELLRGALEKIVFFECRVDQLQAEVEATRAAAARARDDAASSRRREADLEAALAKARASEAAATSERAELLERVRLLEAERERFLTGLVERARVTGAPSDAAAEQGETADLAGFIAELRAEIETLRAWKREAEAAAARGEAQREPAGESTPEARARAAPAVEAPPERRSDRPQEGFSALAARFERDGRIRVSEGAARGLSHGLATRSERALYESALDDLSASDVGTRRRAAERLRALGAKAAAPLVAAAIGREPDAAVKAALLAALGTLAEPGAADLAVRELADARPPVRAAALDALYALAREDAVQPLARALSDAAPLVRRRAALLLGFCRSSEADEALASALQDRDGGVARAAAVALAGRPNPLAQAALARAVASPRVEVRRSAAKAVGRWADGIAVADSDALDAVDRRAVARKLTERLRELDTAALRGAVARAPVAVAARASARARAAASAIAARTASRTASTATIASAKAHATAARAPAAAVAVAEVPAEVASAVLAEVRSALRGRTLAEIAESVAAAPVALEGALRALSASGAIVARGARYYAA